MSILTESLPDYVTIDDRNYPVRTDFRVWLEADEVINSYGFSPEEKLIILIRLCFDSEKCRYLPKDADKIMPALCNFYMCGVPGRAKGEAKKARVFSFSEDAEYICAAFLAQYGIDLLSVPYMHWYKFSALFKALDDNSRLMKIISWRSINLADIKDSEKRRYYRKLKEMYALCDNRTDSEKEHDFAEELSKMF